MIWFLLFLIGMPPAFSEDQHTTQLQDKLDGELQSGGQFRVRDSVIEGFLQRVGDPLDDRDVAALKKLIAASDCKSTEQKSGFGPTNETQMVPRPACGKSDKPIRQCKMSIHCTGGPFNFSLSAICFTELKTCPAAKTCALQSEYDSNDKRAVGAEPLFSTQWVWGNYDNH